MNTTPLAPSRAVPGNSSQWSSPVTKAVTAIAFKRDSLPKRSSSPGPRTSSSMTLLV